MDFYVLKMTINKWMSDSVIIANVMETPIFTRYTGDAQAKGRPDWLISYWNGFHWQ